MARIQPKTEESNSEFDLLNKIRNRKEQRLKELRKNHDEVVKMEKFSAVEKALGELEEQSIEIGEHPMSLEGPSKEKSENKQVNESCK